MISYNFNEIKKISLIMIFFFIPLYVINVESKKNDYRLHPIERKSLYSNGKKILYISRHGGTISNFCYIATNLGFNITVLEPIYNYQRKPNCYYTRNKCKSFVKSKCFEFDYIIISDIIPDSYIFLINKCDTKIILEITNRFDFGVPKFEKNIYYKTISKAKKRKNIIFIENNPFEIYYLCDKNIFIQNYYLIRPIGLAPISKINKKEIFHNKVAVINNWNQGKILGPILKKLNISFNILESKYGGPLTLTNYKAIIHIPYQVSVMKMMENFRYGIPMIIPTERLLREILDNNKNIINYRWIKMALNIKNGIKNYIEFYNDEFKELFIYFDNFADLPNIIEITNFKDLSLKEKEFMKNYENKMVKIWSEALDILPKKESLISDKKPLCNKISIND